MIRPLSKALRLPCLLAACAVSLLPANAARADVASEIAQLTQPVSNSQSPQVAGLPIVSGSFLATFYDQRDFAPAWLDAAAAQGLLNELGSGLLQGFRPADFHLPALLGLYEAAKAGGDAEKAAFEIAASDAAARLIHHTVFGKVDAETLHSGWNFDRPVIERDPAEVLNNALASGGFGALMDVIEIRNPQYDQLVMALARYRELEADGGWPQVPADPVLKPGMEDARVPLLRQRLAISGDYFGPQEASPLYDAALQTAVEEFQSRHGLAADGVLGPKTFTALNRTAAERVDQIRLSLERMRWLARTTKPDTVLVNIAGARTYLIRGGQTVWTTRSITGSAYRKTPVFQDTIRYMEFNPTWTVPASIFRKDKLEKIRADVSYLTRNNYQVRNSEGTVIDPYAVDWSGTPAVTLVQQPGDSNALGRVKFMFPNKHAVYLHDTDDRSLFDRAERNLSSGCVRLEEPFEFAMKLMEGAPGWSEARMQEILASGQTTRVDLPVPMPVMLTYWTAWVENGKVQFREDIYGRDAAVLAALDAPY
ncbi:murein L,D-transpeptidase [Pseudoruegeria sp. SHC-113]|uniref:L,D-transpeptidase family protein n=1 Tax=Pseudoruegeria sp. SHC-113 TaxID=2855439 RepID=UPI0021BB7283|nr:L,D-transpeptidase family protein [Pseudoruegeria sp. SHC-113]MCT8159745.1 L,D-transpeptidase family protein [Pseudoruegeria sp. SHC-113]